MLAWLALVASVLQSPPPDSQALQRMVASERAFAAATAQVGVRDGFLTFFASDAVQVVADDRGTATTVVAARDVLASRPLPDLPLASTLVWEPFTGHVSSDGSLGWLTGGYVALSSAEPRTILAKGAYFSVWKRQPDGTWRVWLDEGIELPDVWQGASPFRVAPDPDAGTAGTAAETLDEAERAVESGRLAWRDRLAAGVRIHRQGVMPLVGREAAARWHDDAWRSVRFTVVRTERAASGDLAVALGGYDAVTETGAEHGIWIRVWKRDVTGRWRIVFETSKAAP